MTMLARLLMGQKNGLPPQMQQPFMGLGGLPPFEQPGASLEPARYISSPPPPALGPGPMAAPPANMPSAQAPMPQPSMQPSDALPPPDVPPMPPPTPVADGSVRSDVTAAAQQLLAQKKLSQAQFLEMFPQFAGGSLTQLSGGG